MRVNPAHLRSDPGRVGGSGAEGDVQDPWAQLDTKGEVTKVGSVDILARF